MYTNASVPLASMRIIFMTRVLFGLTVTFEMVHEAIWFKFKKNHFWDDISACKKPTQTFFKQVTVATTWPWHFVWEKTSSFFFLLIGNLSHIRTQAAQTMTPVCSISLEQFSGNLEKLWAAHSFSSSQNKSSSTFRCGAHGALFF